MSTYSQIYIQMVFAVKGRRSLINPSWEEELYKYITGIVQKKGQKMLAINGMPDHIHIFINLKPDMCISALVREIKKSSNQFVNQKFPQKSFSWQEGFGAFSYSTSDIDKVCKYILNQKEHHRVKSFKMEYISLLREFNIDFNDKYLFDFIEDFEIDVPSV